jgi:hypothetical protein
MELVFVRIKESKWCDQAEPFADTFAKENNLKLTKYSDIEDTPTRFNIKFYPVLFFVQDGKILGHVKGFTDPEHQMDGYKNELKFIKNPELRPVDKTPEFKPVE